MELIKEKTVTFAAVETPFVEMEEETVVYKLYEYEVVKMVPGMGVMVPKTEKRYEVHETGAGTFEAGYVAKYEALSYAALCGAFEELAH